jgi:hypothetical protein
LGSFFGTASSYLAGSRVSFTGSTVSTGDPLSIKVFDYFFMYFLMIFCWSDLTNFGSSLSSISGSGSFFFGFLA